MNLKTKNICKSLPMCRMFCLNLSLKINPITKLVKTQLTTRQKKTPIFIQNTIKSYKRIKETPLYAHGSYTIEAAVVLPVYVGVMILVMMMFRILQIQYQVGTILNQTAREVAVTAYLEQDVMNLANTEFRFRKAISQNQLIDKYVIFDDKGVSLLGSDWEGEDIMLQASYLVEMPVKFFDVDQVLVCQKVIQKKWNGEDLENNGEDWVYITEHGTVYHTSKYCTNLKVSVLEDSTSNLDKLRASGNRKLQPCSKCAGSKREGRIYYSKSGKYYHYRADCSALIRKVQMIPVSEIGNRKLCTKCQEK